MTGNLRKSFGNWLSTDWQGAATLAQTDRNEEATVVQLAHPHRPHGRWRRVAAGVCLVAPVVALLWVPWYAQDRPELAGVPFFYWYQLAWVPGCSLAMLTAYLLTRRPPQP
jgi:hypothetical protein